MPKFFLSFFLLASIAFARNDIYDSGGILTPHQAAYDVTFYDLHLEVAPQDSSINGRLSVEADIVHPLDLFVLNLDTLLQVEKITEKRNGKDVKRIFTHINGLIKIDLRTTRQAGERIDLTVHYNGRPRVAKNPPWDGGFTWARTSDGQPWIATSCQGEGADIWWPNKDHLSDEADSMGIHIRVPEGLFCASNGRLRGVEKHGDGSETTHWFVSTPINNYTVALNIAPYALVEEDYTSVSGETIPVKFWVLPEDLEKGKKILPEFIEHLRFFEEMLGPYPFRADKYGIAQTPHLGMEHQTIIAYGANFDNGSMTGGKDWGFDALHHHELAHEWWGNLVTAADWKDLWIHEGFGTYMQALYMERLQGMAGYREYIASMRHFSNNRAIAPKESVPGSVIYRAPIYSKGANVLHALRYLIGEENLMLALRRMAYPDLALEKITDGSHTRLVNTTDFVTICEEISGQKLQWFFDVYVHQPELPKLKAKLDGNTLKLAWVSPNDLPFPMPLELKTGDMLQRVTIPAGGALIEIDNAHTPEMDPNRWLLWEPWGIEQAMQHVESSNYPEATTAFESALFVDPNNSLAKRMLKHVQYAQSPDMDGNVFDRFLGHYVVNKNRDYDIVKEDDAYYITSRRIKYRVYPVSENSFVVKEFNADYVFDVDDSGAAKGLTLKNARFKMYAEKVE